METGVCFLTEGHAQLMVCSACKAVIVVCSYSLTLLLFTGFRILGIANISSSTEVRKTSVFIFLSSYYKCQKVWVGKIQR